MKLNSLKISRTVKVAGGETTIEGVFTDLKEHEGVDAVSQVEDLAVFAINEALEKINDAPKEEKTQHPEPAPGTDFDKKPEPTPQPGNAPETPGPEKDPEPESRPADAPAEVPAAAPEPASAEDAPYICDQCGDSATKNDKSISAEFLPKDMAGKVLCQKCMQQFKKDQLDGKKPEISEKPPVEEKPAEPAPTVEEDTGFKCSSCGKPISKAEEQLSNIFMGRALCKKCLEEAQK